MEAFQSSRIIKSVIYLNLVIISLIAIGYKLPWIGFFGGLGIIFYLTQLSLGNPIKALLMYLGTKLTFDGLWYLQLTVMLPGHIHLQVLSIVPFLIIVFSTLSISRESVKWPLRLSSVYLAWVVLATAFNGRVPDVDLIIRQSGIFFGLLIGLKYVRRKEDFSLLCKVIFISTIIPSIVSLIQYMLNEQGISILFHKLDSVRGFRLSGLYYDPATAGMVNIVSLITNLYLILYGDIPRKYTIALMVFYALSLFVIIIGGTRSMMGVAAVLTVLPLITQFKKAIKFLPFILVILFFTQGYISGAIYRTQKETRNMTLDDFKNILSETEYTTAFTGRVYVWQEVWRKFKSGSFFQQLIGAGLTSNCHSSYFFLLLQIGLFGMLFYLFVHMKLIFEFVKMKFPDPTTFFGFLGLIAALMIGITATVVMYTSFQWILYFTVGAALNIQKGEREFSEPALPSNHVGKKNAFSSTLGSM